MSAKARSPVAFGPYVITRRIARGGMAEIYRARTRKGDARWVAVKMMRPSLGHEDLRERLFQREARIASKMSHPSIVPVFEFGTEMERPYIAMEYVRGRDLSHLLKNEKKGRDLLDFNLGLYIGMRAAAGLGHAHRAVDDDQRPLGIVHRDMSPGNVMIGYDGSVKVLDFGVARMNETQGVHTQTGTLRGKFAYMSPEQTLGEDLDARSDVFSLGTVLYELLTGINCFRAQSPISSLERVQALRPVPPSRANRAIPKPVDRILARCLAKDKKRRFKDCRALEEALGEFVDKQKLDLHAMLVAHMDEQFSWEKHEEEQELTREEEEVAIFDVVDFAALGDIGGLDARDVQVSHEEEASQAEVKRHSIQREEGDQEVFQEELEQPTSRIPTGPKPLPSEEMEDQATLAQPRDRAPKLELDGPLAGEVQVSSLLDPARSEDSTPGYGTPVPAHPLMSRAGVPIIRGQTEPGTARNTLFDRRATAFYRRPIAAVGALALLILSVAVGVTFGVERERTIEPDIVVPTTTIEPVHISLDDEAPPPPKTPPKPPPKVAVKTALPPDPRPTPVSVIEDPPERPIHKVEPKRVEPPPPVRKPPKPRSKPLPPKPPQTGFLNVGAQPWAHISIDGKRWPYQTPQAGIELPVGKHTILLTNDQTGITKSQVVVIKQGTYKTLMVDLRKK